MCDNISHFVCLFLSPSPLFRFNLIILSSLLPSNILVSSLCSQFFSLLPLPILLLLCFVFLLFLSIHSGFPPPDQLLVLYFFCSHSSSFSCLLLLACRLCYKWAHLDIFCKLHKLLLVIYTGCYQSAPSFWFEYRK